MTLQERALTYADIRYRFSGAIAPLDVERIVAYLESLKGDS